ncbi:DUF6777 domain-containing protein [Streptomyces sp. NPDC059985]|uniref:DUF6777 domain-containing protein n=1 Tax=Streptomyces sp. NPDC059985 TaxID=3347025 RepID=UPI0036B03A02
MSGGGQGAPPPPPSGGPSGRPWWRSPRGSAAAVVALAAVAALVVVLTRSGGGGTPTPNPDRAGAEVFLQPAAATGPDPFTESTAAEEATVPPASRPPGPSTSPTRSTGAPLGIRSVTGSAPGLYGGTKNVASCDVEKQIAVLSAEPPKNAAFASALGIRPAAVPGYLRSLTPVQLALDTRVTNHGFRDGRATPYQAVLQAGTAVLVDDRGVPRVRCACGNPLGAAVALKADAKRQGRPWSSYRPQDVVVIAPSVTIVNKIVIYDHEDRRWFERERGADPKRDRPVPPPVIPTPKYTTPPVSPPVTPPVSPPASDGSPPVTSPPVTDSGTPDGPSSVGPPSDGSGDTPSDGPGDTPSGESPASPEDSPADSPGGTSPDTSEGPSTQSRAPGLTEDSGTPTGPSESGPPDRPKQGRAGTPTGTDSATAPPSRD